MMKLVFRLTFISFLFVFSASSFALTVGEKQLNSAIDQKLDARVELLNVRRDEAASMAITLASELIYQRMGVERSPILEKLVFTLQRNELGKYYIHITSDFVVSRPFFTFLVELNWDNGRLLREFTLFMDPPIFLDENLDTIDTRIPRQAELLAKFGAIKGEKFDDTGITDSLNEIEKYEADQFETDLIETGLIAKVLTPVETVSLRTDEIKVKEIPDLDIVQNQDVRKQIAQNQIVKNTATKKTIIQKIPVPTSLVYAKVKKNEILWRIADKMRPANVTVEQMMLALHKENPGAFTGGNLSSLKVGSTLRIRDVSELTKISVKEAKLAVARQNDEWLASKKIETSISTMPDADVPVTVVPVVIAQVKMKKSAVKVDSEKIHVESKSEEKIALELEADNVAGRVSDTKQVAKLTLKPEMNFDSTENNSLIVVAKSAEPIKVITFDMLLADKKLLGVVLISILLLIILAGWLINRIFYHKYFVRKQLENPLDQMLSRQTDDQKRQTTVVQFEEIARSKNIGSEHLSNIGKQSVSVNS